MTSTSARTTLAVLAPRPRRPGVLCGVALAAVALVGCSSDVTTSRPRLFDRPTDVGFGCVGGVPTDDGGVESVALPASACADLPDGGSGTAEPAIEDPSTYGFVIEPIRGTATLTAFAGYGEIRDSDPYTPGYNGLPVGRLPAGIATTASGCFAVTANEGSCDLGVIDVFGAVAAQSAVVTRRLVASSAGLLGAAPAAIAAPPALAVADRVACDGGPAGLVYLAFPGCSLVAAVNLAGDGTAATILQGVRFAEGGAPALTGGDVTCPVDCPELADRAAAGTVAPGAPQPSALAVEPGGGRLFVGAWNSPTLTIVGLDSSGLPTAVSTLDLEGAGGIRRLAATGPISMGQGGVAGDFAFVYAVAADGTVHVADVTTGRAPRECEAQADPRAVRGETDLSRLACLPVGSVPRRAGAEGPGIRLPRGAVPRDVAFLRAEFAADAPEPDTLNGLFAIVTADDPVGVGRSDATALRGVAFYVNVDDRNYTDLEDPDDPSEADITLALAHSLRDSVEDRGLYPELCVEPTYPSGAGPVRLAQSPGVPDGLPGWLQVNWQIELPSEERFTVAPMLHREYCTCEEAGCPSDPQPVWSLSAAASADVREWAFADLGAIRDESWTVAWQGSIRTPASESQRAGGEVSVESPRLVLRDGAGPFCDLGAETYDVVQLLGCRSDSDCGYGELCYVHPEAPAGLAGVCVESGRESELADTCRAFMTTLRRYTAVRVAQDELTLASRPVILGWTPIEGCSSDTECTTIREAQATFLEGQAGIDPSVDERIPRYTWNCASDPAFGGVSRCVMTCDPAAPDCADGSVCQAGRCVEGPVPPAACVAALQRYEVTAAFAYSVVGSDTGYLHGRVVDPATGECIDDPTASPLDVGRFRLVEPECVLDAPPTVAEPNPCSLVLEEPVRQDGAPATREAQGIRFRNRALGFDLADVFVPLPEVPGKHYAPAPPGYRLVMRLVSGFSAKGTVLDASFPDRIRPDPDGSLWIVDSGDERSTGRRGQLIHFTGASSPVDQTLE